MVVSSYRGIHSLPILELTLSKLALVIFGTVSVHCHKNKESIHVVPEIAFETIKWNNTMLSKPIQSALAIGY